MKSLAVAVALTTTFAFPVYAGTVHPRHTAMPINHEQGHTAAIRNRGVYLLENSAAGSAKQVPNFQDNFASGNELPKTVVQQATPQEQNAFREGGALRPLPAIWLDCSRKFGPRDACTWAW